MGVAGGALFPPLMALLKDHRSIHLSFILPLIGFVMEFVYGIWVHKWIRYVKEDPAAIDPEKETTSNSAEKRSVVEEQQERVSIQDVQEVDKRHPWPFVTTTHTLLLCIEYTTF